MTTIFLHRRIGVLLITAAVGSFLLTEKRLPAEEPDQQKGIAPTAVKAFLDSHCIDCHGKETQEGDVSLHRFNPAAVTGEDAELWKRVVSALKFAQMPPQDQSQPPRHEVLQVATWIQQQLVAAGFELDVDHKLKHPAYANLINHEKLFDGSQAAPAFSPPRLWRLHPEAYQNFLAVFGRQLGEGGPLSKPLTVGDGKGLPSNYADLLQADSATLGQLMLNCRQIAIWQTSGFKRMKKDNRTKQMVERHYVNMPESFLAIVNREGPPADDQLQAAVDEEFLLVLGRRPNEDEANRYRDLLKQSIEIGGKLRGLQTMAMAVLMRPEAIYRMEVGITKPDQHGRRMLSPYELAYAIAFALTDTPPEQLLLGPAKPNDRSKRPQPPSLMDLADDGKLQTRQDVRDVVAKIWEHQQIEKPRILRFFREFFGYHAAESVFKGDRADKSFATKFFVSDADQLVMHVVRQDRDVLKELLTTTKYFIQWPGSQEEYDRKVKYITDRLNKGRRQEVNYKYFVERSEKGLRPIAQANPTWRQTVRFYNLDEQTWDYPLDQPLEMPATQRVGILTHPAWLVAWSGNFGNDPIRRGKWIREHLLAGSIPDVPITVNAQVPEDPHQTLRQRLQVTRDEYCWQCHQKMEPLGLPFEAYTDFGRFRREEGLGSTRALKKAKETAAVVTSGQIIRSGDASIDGEVKDVHELMHRLAGSQRVRQSFIRHAFRYWMGRNEMLSDSQTLIAADNAYVDGGGSFKAMVIQLLTSDSFLYRK